MCGPQQRLAVLGRIEEVEGIRGILGHYLCQFSYNLQIMFMKRDF